MQRYSHPLCSHVTAEHDGTREKGDTTSLQPSQYTSKALPDHIPGIVLDPDLKGPMESRVPVRKEDYVSQMSFNIRDMLNNSPSQKLGFSSFLTSEKCLPMDSFPTIMQEDNIQFFCNSLEHALLLPLSKTTGLLPIT